MKGYKTRRGNASRNQRGRAVRPSSHPAHPSHPDRAARLVGLIAAGALGGLGGGVAVGVVGFASVPGSGLSVAAARHDIAPTSGSGARSETLGRVWLTSSFSEAFVAPLPSPSPSPTNPNKPVPTTSPSVTPLPTPGDPNQSAPLPTPTPTPTPTPSKSSTSPAKKGSTTSKKGSTGGPSPSLNALDAGSTGGGDTPLVNVPAISPENPTGLFPTVSPGSGSNSGGKDKRIDAVTTAATTPLDTLIPGQVVGLAVLIGAIALAFVRFSLRTPPSDGSGKPQ
jgi:hypothetical protein